MAAFFRDINCNKFSPQGTNMSVVVIDLVLKLACKLQSYASLKLRPTD